MIHHNLTIGSHAQRYFSQRPDDRLPENLTSLSHFLRYRCTPLYSQVHEPPGDVWRRPLRSHLHHECRHIEQVPGAKLWFNQLSCSELFHCREKGGLNLRSTCLLSSTTSTAWFTASSQCRAGVWENLIVVTPKSTLCLWRRFLWLTWLVNVTSVKSGHY